MCCLNYKGKEVEGCELKLSRLTADKKQPKFFQYPDAFKNLRWGCIFKEDSQQNHRGGGDSSVVRAPDS